MNTTGRTPYEEAYDAIQCDTLEHADSRFIHQHVVDAWAAQHATELTKPIALTFALVGLYLRVERGYTGRQVQRVHMDMARQKHEWPRFPLPQHGKQRSIAGVPRCGTRIATAGRASWSFSPRARGPALWLRRRRR